MTKEVEVMDFYALAAQDKEFAEDIAKVDEGGWRIGDEANVMQMAVVGSTYAGWYLGKFGAEEYRRKFYDDEPVNQG